MGSETDIMRLGFRELAERLVAEGRLWDYYLIATAIAPDPASQRVAKEELRRALRRAGDSQEEERGRLGASDT